MMRTRILFLLMTSFGWIGPGQAQSADMPAMPAPDLARLKARTVCSCLFVQQMSFEQCADGKSAIWRYPFGAMPVPALLASEKQRLHTVLGASSAAVQFLEDGKPIAHSLYIDDGGGCVTSEAGKPLAPPSSHSGEENTTVALPRAPLPASADAKAVQKALDEGFAVEGPLSGYARAVLVVHDGRVVAEQYAPGFGPHNKYYLGSVAKLFNNLLAGLLVRDGKLRVQDPVAFPEWRSADDPRGKITFDQMLHMTSGLDWADEFDAAGTFLAGHPVYARAEDMARIELLLSRDGRWEGRQVLPKGWVEYSALPAGSGEAAKSDYGAHLMLSMLGVSGCFGHSGVGEQQLIVCPKRKLVVVWFSSAFDFFRQRSGDPADVERRLVQAFPE